MWASTPTKETYVVHTKNAPHGTPCGAIAFLIILADMKNGGCEGEVDEQGQEVHDRRDDRGGHDLSLIHIWSKVWTIFWSSTTPT